MRGGLALLGGSGAEASASSSSCTKPSPVTPWALMVAKVLRVIGVPRATEMRTSTWPLAFGSKPIDSTLPTGTPRKRTPACACKPAMVWAVEMS